jgi:hypothetical protein
MRLERVELDLEDEKNPRINIIVRDGPKEIKQILFRPSELLVQLSEEGAEEGLRTVSVNTVTTLEFHKAAPSEFVDGIT